MGQCISSNMARQADLDTIRERLSQQVQTSAIMARSIEELTSTVTTLGKSVEEIIDIMQALNENQQEMRSPQAVDVVIDESNRLLTEDEPTNDA